MLRSTAFLVVEAVGGDAEAVIPPLARRWRRYAASLHPNKHAPGR
jgi:hypothetical protein